jgi:hypothetical protein
LDEKSSYDVLRFEVRFMKEDGDNYEEYSPLGNNSS